MKPVKALCLLEKLSRIYHADAEEKKLTLLNHLQSAQFSKADDIYRLHEVLCYLRAYPDSARIYKQVALMLKTFQCRHDLNKHGNDLINSGIRGTNIEYNFFSPMARWLTDKWPGNLEIIWDELDIEDLYEFLPLLVTPAEIEQFDSIEREVNAWIALLKAPDETDGVFLKKRLDRIAHNQFASDMLHDKLDIPFRIVHGDTTPSITDLRHPVKRIIYQTSPFNSKRPDLRKSATSEQFTIKRQSLNEGRKLADLARATMVTRERDLDGFSYGDPGDVSIASFKDGIQIVMIGLEPEQRYLLHATYSFLVLKNGYPIGYGPVNFIYGIGDLAFTTFSTFRGTEAAYTLGKVIALSHQLFQINMFVLDPYQLGHDNDDGLNSGVWWFYYKLGFRPRNAEIKQLLRQELAKMKKKPGYRSSISVLNALSSDNMYFEIERGKSDASLADLFPKISQSVSRYLSLNYGADREKGTRETAINALNLTGRRRFNSLNTQQKAIWEIWGPIVQQLKGVNRWSTIDRSRLSRLINAKGNGRESEFNRLFLEHRKLQNALLKLARSIED